MRKITSGLGLKIGIYSAALAMAMGLTQQALAQNNTSANPVNKQDLQQLTAQTLSFLQREANAYPGQVEVRVIPLDPHLKLAPCPSPQFGLANGSSAWGKTTVVIQCLAPSRWTVYQQANVSVFSQYLVAAAPLTQGHQLTETDVLSMRGDLTQLPAGIFTDVKQVLGRTASVSLLSGAVLRHETLKLPRVVQMGQNVMLTTIGKGFQISAEGKALNNAVEGQQVQVKVVSGEVISGIARAGGRVEVSF